MDYNSMRKLLEQLGIWARNKPGPRNKSLRWDSESGQPIPGTHLNESTKGRAFITLNSDSIEVYRNGHALELKRVLNLWCGLPSDEVPAHFDNKPPRLHIYPVPDKECEALKQLFRPQKP